METKERECPTCNGSGGIDDDSMGLIGKDTCPTCLGRGFVLQQNKTENSSPVTAKDESGSDAPQPTRETVKEGNEPIERRIDIEVYDITALLSSIIRGTNGATEELVVINEDRITALARKLGTKPGDDIIPGVRVKG